MSGELSRTPGAGVTWYELLDVPTDAAPEQIKAAWRDATDKFEPGQGTAQFRLFNEAADVLLDPAQRAAYDAQIGVTAPAGTVAAPEAAPVTVSATAPVERSEAVEDLPTSHVEPTKQKQKPKRAPAAAGTARAFPRWALALLTVLTVAALSLGGVFLVKDRHDGAVADAGDEATAAAERALPLVLSYDYRHLTADRDQAVRYLAPRYQKEYTATFDKLIESSDGQPGAAAQTKAVVKATVQDIGVVNAETGRVRVIVFLDQLATKNGAAPKQSLNRLTVSMVKDGNSWLVENISSF